MLSGEWGYTSATAPCLYPNRVDEQTQAAYLVRMWLTNSMVGVGVSIDYDWSDGPSTLRGTAWHAIECHTYF